jgi:hypothetical protein
MICESDLRIHDPRTRRQHKVKQDFGKGKVCVELLAVRRGSGG